MVTVGWIMIAAGFLAGPLCNKQAHISKWWFYGSLVVACAGTIVLAWGTGNAT